MVVSLNNDNDDNIINIQVTAIGLRPKHLETQSGIHSTQGRGEPFSFITLANPSKPSLECPMSNNTVDI